MWCDCEVRQARRTRTRTVCGLLRRTSGIQRRIRAAAEPRRTLVLRAVLRLLLCVPQLLWLPMLMLPLRHGHVRRRRQDWGRILTG